MPGQAWLELRIDAARSPDGRVDPDRPGAVLHQRALFAPKGLLGRLYWWAMLPFHTFIFSSMARTLAARAADSPVAVR